MNETNILSYFCYVRECLDMNVKFVFLFLLSRAEYSVCIVANVRLRYAIAIIIIEAGWIIQFWVDS